MRIKHTWTQLPKKTGLMGGGKTVYDYRLDMRAAITEEERTMINKYDHAKAVLYSTKEAHADRQRRVTNAGGVGDMWREAWSSGGLPPEAEYTLYELLHGITITHHDPHLLDDIFKEITGACTNIMGALTSLEQVFDGEETITEIEY